MAVENIELIPPFIIPTNRVNFIVGEIVAGRYYGQTKTTILEPGSSVEARLDVKNARLFHRVLASSDGKGAYEIYRLEDIKPGSNVTLKHDIERSVIDEGSSPICIFDAVSSQGDRIRIRSVCRYRAA